MQKVIADFKKCSPDHEPQRCRAWTMFEELFHSWEERFRWMAYLLLHDGAAAEDAV